MELVDFLRARLDEDERAARRAGDSFRQIGETGVIVATEGDRAEECASANWAGAAEHIVRHDPARVLAEVESKRRLLLWAESAEGGLFLFPVVDTLVEVYRNHPDFDPAWLED